MPILPPLPIPSAKIKAGRREAFFKGIRTMLTIFAAGVTGGHDGKLGRMYTVVQTKRGRSNRSRGWMFAETFFHI